jgi:hypothetical protein
MSAHQYNRIGTWAITVFGAFIVSCAGAYAGQFVRVSPELRIHYVEAGRGAPIVFIPGWTCTAEIMHKQVDYFSKN